MTRLTTTLMATCMAAILGVTAPASAQSTPDKKGMMTTTGCVVAGPGTGQYMLGNAMMSGAMGKDTTAKPGMMMSYELMGGTDMKAHVGQKVEVMGTMSMEDMDRMMKMEKMDKMARDKMMADKTMSMMKLHVTTMKMVSATCQ